VEEVEGLGFGLRKEGVSALEKEGASETEGEVEAAALHEPPPGVQRKVEGFREKPQAHPAQDSLTLPLPPLVVEKEFARAAPIP